jgi:hypothetical protein
MVAEAVRELLVIVQDVVVVELSVLSGQETKDRFLVLVEHHVIHLLQRLVPQQH